MSKLNTIYRAAASTLFVMAAAGPFLAWGTYLFAVQPGHWRESLEFAFSPENESRYFFLLMGVAGIFSAAAAVIVAVQSRRLLLRGVLAGGIAQSLAYAAVGAWFLMFVAACPLWWAYKVQHEV